MKQSIETQKSILFILRELIVGGVEKVLMDTINLLQERYKITVLALCGKLNESLLSMMPQNVEIISAEYEYNKKIMTMPFASKKYYDRLISDKKYDYMIAMKGVNNSCFSNKAKNHIYWDHTDLQLRWLKTKLGKGERVYKFYYKLLYKKYDAVWVVNDEIKKVYETAFSLSNVYTLPNPLDCETVIEKSNVECDTEFDKNKINIVMVGRLAEEKGFDRVIRGLSESRHKYHLYIVGDGPQRESLEELISKNGLKETVTLLGSKTNPYNYLKQAQLFVCPSHIESFGLVILEAMLLKIPVITTKTIGGEYLTQNGEYACCVENTDDAIKRAIADFLDNPSGYKYSLEKAYNRACEFDIIQFGNKLEYLLSDFDKKK